MRLVGHGSPAIRATHGKTFELSPDAEITERATCIVAVGVGAATTPLAGWVRITISAGDESFALQARANSGWVPGGPAVIRRSPLRLPGTLATEATAAAADLPRSLVAAMQDPRADVVVDVEPIPGPPTAVLYALDPAQPDPRLRAELGAADLVVAEDDDAAYLLGERVAPGPVAVTGRVLVVAVRDLPGQSVQAALRTVAVDTVGLTPPLAAAAAFPARGPVLLDAQASDPRELLRRAPAGTRVVVGATADRVAGLLRSAAEIRGPAVAVLARALAPPVRVEPGEYPELPGKDRVHLCFAVDADNSGPAPDPAVRAAIDGLLAEGVPTKAAARALATLSGWDRRRAYEAVLNWKSDPGR